MPAESVTEVFERHIPERLRAKPDVAAKLAAVYQFDVGGDGGGTWSVDCTAPGGVVVLGPHPGAGCTVTCEGQVLLDVVNGRLSPAIAYMAGQLQVQGDIGLAMKLQQILT